MHINTGARAALEKIGAKKGKVRILVVGDLILDRFLYGSVDRISPEAPVPVVDVDREMRRPGGAANVVLNLLAMGAPARICGVVGDDPEAVELSDMLSTEGCDVSSLLADPSRPTALKTRVIAQHQQVVRFDRESREPLTPGMVGALAEKVAEAAADADAVIISDYGKTVIRSATMAAVESAGVIFAVDPKPVNFGLYKGADVITPNTKETFEMTGIRPVTDEDAERAGRELIARLGVKSALVTRGERGMSFVGEGEAHHIPTRARDVFDVTGAGDTSISIYTLALASGATPFESACLSNLAGSIVVGKLGTATVTAGELAAALDAELSDCP